MYSQNVRPGTAGRARSNDEQEDQDQQLGARVVELRRVQRPPSGVPALAAATGLVNVIAHGTIGFAAVAAAGQQAAQPADDVAERDARREQIGRRPHRQTVAAAEPEPDRHGDDQPAVEHAGRARERQDLARLLAEVVEIDDDQHQLGADERRDDEVDPEVHDPRGVEARAGARGRPPAAARPDTPRPAARRTCRPASCRSQTGWDTCRFTRSSSTKTSMAPTVIDASATLNAQKCQPPPVDVHEIDDVAGVQPIDQVAERAAENQREPDARQPLLGPHVAGVVARCRTSASAGERRS